MFNSNQTEKFTNLLNYWEIVGEQEYISEPKEQEVTEKVKSLIVEFQPKDEILIRHLHSEYLNENKENQTNLLNYQFSYTNMLMRNDFKKLPDVLNFKKEKLLVKTKQFLASNEILKQHVCYMFLMKTIKFKKYNVLNFREQPCLNNKEDKNFIVKKNEVKENKRKISDGFSCDLEEVIVEQIIKLVYEEGFKWLITIAPTLINGIIVYNFFSNFF